MARWLRSGLRRDVCAVVADLEEPTSQKIKRAVERRYDGSVKPRTFRGALSALVESGHLEARTEGIHDRYSLTAAGEAALRDHHEWVADCLSE